MFTRVGEIAIKKDLHNTLAMCEALGHPQRKFKSVHVGGTNGKGSTSHMLAAVLQQAGYKTGLYTSPHLKDFRERIRINGKMVPKSFVINFVKAHRHLIDKIAPSFFEVTVAMAFDYFAQQKVDIAIIEVGLGGRLDSTNVINPELAVITNISLDHTNILGNTRQEIAQEKAGIIKKNTPVVIGEKQEEVEKIFRDKAQEQGSTIYFAGSELSVKEPRVKRSLLQLDVYQNGRLLYPDLALDLTGLYQLKNISTVIKAVQLLRENDFQVSDSDFYDAIKKVKKLTGLQGRWQTLHQNPLIICDTGHNIAGITEVLQNISNTRFDRLHMVLGMVKDKDIGGVLTLLPTSATYYFCEPKLERALRAPELKAKAQQFGLKGKSYPTVALALAAAKNQAEEKDLIFVGGSTFVVAEIL